MKKNLTATTVTIPKRLTNLEVDTLAHYIALPGWQFDSTIRPMCVIIERPIIDGYYSETAAGAEPTFKSVSIFGLIGQDRTTKEQVIANYFVRNESHLYQVYDIDDARHIVSLITKDYKFCRYMQSKAADLEAENLKVAS